MYQPRICQGHGLECHRNVLGPKDFPTGFKTPRRKESHATRQTRICNHFGRKCSHERTFLSLPKEVRHDIYQYAGLIQNSLIALHKTWKEEDNDEGILDDEYEELSEEEDEELSEEEDEESSKDYRTSFNLLLTCRQVHDEVFFILYHTNRICIDCNRQDNLQKLRNLSVKALSLLTGLEIVLRTETRKNQRCPTWCGGRVCRHNGKPLSRSTLTVAEHYFLEEWSQTAKYLSSHLTPSALDLYFQCDVKDIDMAQVAVAPFRDFPTVKQCSIRLSIKRVPSLKALARKVSTRLLGQTYHSSFPFRILDLPDELILNILEYTDLIAPGGEVHYNLSKRFSVEWCSVLELMTHTQAYHMCHDYLCDVNDRGVCFLRCHSAWSSSCHCWAPPTALFLTCRKLTTIAQQVFFSQNRFIFTPPESRYDSKSEPYLSVSLFLRDTIPRQALQHLRRLDVKLPACNAAWAPQTPLDSAYVHWRETLTRVEHDLRLPQLMIRVYVLVVGCVYPRRIITTEDETLMREQYAKFCEPLARLNGLGRLCAHVVVALPWVDWHPTIPPNQLHDVQQIHLQVKSQMTSFLCDQTEIKWKLKCAQYTEPDLYNRFRALPDTQHPNYI